jgi:YfiH family protein
MSCGEKNMKEFKRFQGVRGGFEGKETSGDFAQLQGLLLLKQVHGDKVHVLKSEPERAQLHLQEGDAILSLLKRVPIAVKTADCVPILLAHPEGIVGAVHAGWRGTHMKILEKALLKIRDEFKKDISKIHVAIGPAICSQCYEVGEEVAREFAAEYLKEKGEGKLLLDLKRANFDLANKMGVPANQIEILEDCTLCQHEDYYSYRHEMQQGLSKEGRNYSWVMMG